MGFVGMFDALTNIFYTGKDEKTATRVWHNDFLWDLVDPTGLEHVWLAAGGFANQFTNRFEHPSAHSIFQRDGVLRAMGPLIEQNAWQGMGGNSTLTQGWASVELPEFWEKLVQAFAQANPRDTTYRIDIEGTWAAILGQAGEYGNTTPFRYAPAPAVAKYAALHLQDGNFHPKVGLWLANEGLCTKEQLAMTVNAETFPLQTNCFGCAQLGQPMAPHYVAQWCELLLRDYGLSHEQKILVAGQAIMAFGQDDWAVHLAPVCTAYLQDVNMGMLVAVCGDGKSGHDPGSVEHAARLMGIGSGPLDLKRGQAWLQGMSKSQPSQAQQDLRMLVDVVPPQTRLDLYYLACQVAHGHQRGFIDALELPTLG